MQYNYPFNERPPLWLYHEMSPHKWKRPEYYNLCLETVQKHCGRRFRVISLTRYNIYTYIPDLRKDVWYTCTRRQRTDLIKWELLARYGGLFLDQDVLVLRDLSPYMDKLGEHDFVAFGKSTEVVGAPHTPFGGLTISNPPVSNRSFGTSQPPTKSKPDSVSANRSPNAPKQNNRLTQAFIPPLTWAMASRPRGLLVTLARERCYWLLDNQKQRLLNEPDLYGKHMLWECMYLLSSFSKPTQQWTYYHVSSVCSQCDTNDVEYTIDRFLMNEDVSTDCLQNMYLVPLSANCSSCSFPHWFVYAQRDRLLGNGNTLISKLWRWSLLGETPFHHAQSNMLGRFPTVSVPRFYASGYVS